MPAYRYRCNTCSSRFTVQATIQEMEEGKAAKFACPSCHSVSTKRAFSAGAFFHNIFAKEQKACCGSGDCCAKPAEQPKSDCCSGGSCCH